MHVIVAGASGLIGRAVCARLESDGNTVARLVRRMARSADEVAWQPEAGVIPLDALARVDAVVNLAGVSVAGARWTAARRHAIRQSRIDATRTLVTALRHAPSRSRALVNASAVGWYGDRGDEKLTEAATPGTGFLAEVGQVWEAEASAAELAGVRTCRMRFGVVLAPNGGALAKLLPLFQLGLGGRIGTGKQWMSWVSLEDTAAVLAAAVREPTWSGAFNVVAPHPVTNAEFTRVLAHMIGRPARVPVPAWAVRLAFGEMGRETILASTRAVPARLEALGFVFRHPEIGDALAAAVLPGTPLGATR